MENTQTVIILLLLVRIQLSTEVTILNDKHDEKQIKLITHKSMIYKLEITRVGNQNIIKIMPFLQLSQIPRKREYSYKPVVETPEEAEYLLGNNIYHPLPQIYGFGWEKGIWDRHVPPDPLLQIKLSHYGKYVSDYYARIATPQAFALNGGYGLYSYGAGNDIHNNLPRGGYKFEIDFDNK